jgi:hypothetical protein
MALNFPNNPTVGDLYQTGSSAEYKYTAKNYWEVVRPSPLEIVSASYAETSSYALSSSFSETSSYALTSSVSVSSSYALTASYLEGGAGSSVIISASAPVSESKGTLWFNIDTTSGSGGEMYILMDETSSNWIPVVDKFVDQAVSASYALSASLLIGNDWVDAGTITIGATGTAPTKATSKVYDKVRYRKINSDTYEVEYNYAQVGNAGASAGSGDYLFSLPAGITWGANVLKTTSSDQPTAIGRSIPCIGPLITSTLLRTLAVIPYDNTRFRLYGADSAGTYDPVGAGTGYTFSLAVSGQGYKVRFYTTV